MFYNYYIHNNPIANTFARFLIESVTENIILDSIDTKSTLKNLKRVRN